MSRWEAVQNWIVDVCVWLLHMRKCRENYRALRRDFNPVLFSFQMAARLVTWPLDMEHFLQNDFVYRMAPSWGDDDSWLDRYKGDL